MTASGLSFPALVQSKILKSNECNDLQLYNLNSLFWNNDESYFNKFLI